MIISKSLKKPTVWVVVTLVVSIPLAYYWLGGFNPLQVELVPVDQIYLVGRYFEGRQQSDTIRRYFNEMKEYVQGDTYPGQLVIIYDQEPRGPSGQVKVFVGVRMQKPLKEAAGGLQLRTLEASRAIRISKASHSVVMPNPEDLNKLIADYAREQHLKLRGPSMEIYLPDNRLLVEHPLSP